MASPDSSQKVIGNATEAGEILVSDAGAIVAEVIDDLAAGVDLEPLSEVLDRLAPRRRR